MFIVSVGIPNSNIGEIPIVPEHLPVGLDLPLFRPLPLRRPHSIISVRDPFCLAPRD